MVSKPVQDRPNTGSLSHFQFYLCSTFCLKFDVPTEMGFLFPRKRNQAVLPDLGRRLEV